MHHHVPAALNNRRVPRLALAMLLLAIMSFVPGARADAQQASDSAGAPQISGLIFAHYRYGGEPGQRSTNRFDVERAYLTARARLGHGLSARITADVFQQTDASRDDYYGGWAFRAKYAYLQYDAGGGITAPMGLDGFGRLGIIGTVIIEVVDEHWPRWISKSPVDRYGFMSSADVGAGVGVNTAGEHTELYATVTNGEGYQRGETDRFKDYAARLTLRPLAGASGWTSRVSITPWGSLGDMGSQFATGPGTVEPVARGLDRHMWGVFVGLPGRAITVGVEYAERRDETEAADTLVDVTPAFSERSTRVASGFVVLRPLALLDTASTGPLSLVARFDRLSRTSLSDAHANVVIAGITWDLNPRVSLALDYQEEAPHGGYPLDDTRTWFLHAVARF